MKPIFEAELNFVPIPKGNRYLSNNGRRFLPERVTDSINDTIFLLKNLKQMSKLKTINEYVFLEVVFVLPNNRRKDLDNIMKTLGDCLEKAEIIKDDNLIAKKDIEKVLSTNRESKTIIKIYPHKIKKV